MKSYGCLASFKLSIETMFIEWNALIKQFKIKNKDITLTCIVLNFSMFVIKIN